MSDTHTPTPINLITPGVGRIVPGNTLLSTPTPMRSLQYDNEQETPQRCEDAQAQHCDATIAHVDTMPVILNNVLACWLVLRCKGF